MISLIGIVFAVYLLISHNSLARRVRELEARISGGVPKEAVAPVQPLAQALPNTPAWSPVTAVQEFAPAEPNKFILWLKEDWLMKLGGALFIIGFGWFVSYAFINNWIGPLGRISLGILAGITMMMLGFKRMMKYPSQGAVFLGLGAGMTMLTIFAGRSLYGFYTPTSAILFNFFIACFAAFASYKFKVNSLAHVAQVLAFLAPLLAAGETTSVFLFTYLLVVSLASLVLSSFTGNRSLIVTSLIFVGVYSAPFIAAGNAGMFYGGSRYATDAPLILNFAYMFAAMFLFAGMMAVIKKGVEKPEMELGLAMLNGLFLFIWIYGVAPLEWRSLIFAAWAMVFAMSSFVAFKFSSKLDPFYAYGAVAVAFIGAATAAELQGAELVIAFAIEVALLVMGILVLTKNEKTAGNVSFLFIVPIVLSVSNILRYSSSQNIFSQDFFALAVLALALIFTGMTMARQQMKTDDDDDLKVSSMLIVLGSLYVGNIIWSSLHIYLAEDPDLATMIALLVYTVLGLAAYFGGLHDANGHRRTYGAGILAFVVLHLLIWDVWDMELFGRVVTFIAIGVLLMSTAFITKNKKNE